MSEPLHFERLRSAGSAAVELLARCPRIPADVAVQLLSPARSQPVAQVLLRLRHAGLARVETVRTGGALFGRGSVRLWSLTDAGRAALAGRSPSPNAEATWAIPYGRPIRRTNAFRQAAP